MVCKLFNIASLIYSQGGMPAPSSFLRWFLLPYANSAPPVMRCSAPVVKVASDARYRHRRPDSSI